MADFSLTGKETIKAEQGEQVRDVSERSLSEPLEDLCMGKQMRCLVGVIKTDKSTGDVFDLLWPLLDRGERRLSVRRGVEQCSVSFLIYKADQAKLNLFSLPEEVRPATVHEVLKPSRGKVGAQAILQFVREWFTDFQQITSNFKLAEEVEAPPPVDPENLYKEFKSKPQNDLRFECWRARLQSPTQRDPRARALLAGKAEISAMRREEQMHESKRRLQDGIVFRVGDCTNLVYPDDVPKLPGKLGHTFNPLTKQNEIEPVSKYVETKLHLEKTLVSWGAGGNQKTPSAEAIAKEFAIRYNTKYIKGNGPEALKGVQDEFERLVPVIFEELSADDVAQNGKKLSANYFKHLLDVRNGGQVRVRNVMLLFKPLQPRIICINDTPEEWLQAIDGVKDTDKLPLEKRILFVHVDELVISPKAVAAYEADLDEIVNAGKRRRLEHYSAIDVEKSTKTPSTSADSEGTASSVSGDNSDPPGVCSSKETPIEVKLKRTPASPTPAKEQAAAEALEGGGAAEDSDDSYNYYSDTSSEEN